MFQTCASKILNWIRVCLANYKTQTGPATKIRYSEAVMPYSAGKTGDSLYNTGLLGLASSCRLTIWMLSRYSPSSI